MLRKLTKNIHASILKPNNLKLITTQGITTKKITRYKTFNTPNFTIENCRFLHVNIPKCVKQFVEFENTHARKIIQTIPVFTISTEHKISTDKVIDTEDDFNTFLNQNWRSARPGDVVRGFLNVVDYCRRANINLSDTRFDKLVDGLMDNVEKLTDEELYTIIECLTRFPLTETYSSHNYHDVWSALDDICRHKLPNWNVETMFKFADLFHQLHLGRIGDYIFDFLDRISRKPHKLTYEQLVHAFFYTNVCRKRSIEFEFEVAIEKMLDKFTVDEIAIIAMGFFKTQTKIKLATILDRMLELVIENSETVHEITLAAILKIVRLSQHRQTKDNTIKMLHKITPEIPRLSLLCGTHAVLTCTSMQLFHEPILNAVAEKAIANVSDINALRLKDMERLLFAMTMFDHDPKTNPDFYKTISEELCKGERIPEMILYPKCLPLALSFLSIRNVYLKELMEKVLKPEFTLETYGKNSKSFPREIFSLILNSEIDLPDFKTVTWPQGMRLKAAKWLTEWLPDKTYKNMPAADRLILDVVDAITKITGDKKYLHIDHILPQHAKADIVLCTDRNTNEFVEPTGLKDYQLHEIKRPIDLDKYKWYCFVVVNFNLIARNTFKPVGIVNMKERHLRKIGYEPVLIYWNEYNWLENEEKIDYILNKMKRL